VPVWPENLENAKPRGIFSCAALPVLNTIIIET